MKTLQNEMRSISREMEMIGIDVDPDRHPYWFGLCKVGNLYLSAWARDLGSTQEFSHHFYLWPPRLPISPIERELWNTVYFLEESVRQHGPITSWQGEPLRFAILDSLLNIAMCNPSFMESETRLSLLRNGICI